MSKKKLYEKALRLYVGDYVFDQLNDYGESFLTHGAEKVTATIYTQNISGIKLFDDKLKGLDLVGLQKNMLTEFTKIIQEHKGIIELYEMTKIYAFWRSDIESNHADNAAECALACIDETKKLNNLSGGVHLKSIKLNIGISTGEVLFGNFGSSQRLQYRMLGPTVNMSTQLCSANDTLGTSNLISEYTNNHLSKQIITEEKDAIRVVGEETPVRIYQIVSKRKGIKP